MLFGWRKLLPPGLVCGALLILAQISFPTFHTIAELVAVFIAVMIFAVSWNTFRFTGDTLLMLIAMGYLGVATLDLFHTLTFPDAFADPALGSNNRTLQFWVSARLLEASTLALAPLIAKKLPRETTALLAISLVTLACTYLIFSGSFPTTYVDGAGLTAFKVNSEYVVICLSLIAIVQFNRTDKLSVEKKILLSAAIATTIVAEFLFTSYIGMNDEEVLWGHLFKIFSFWFIYRAIIVSSLTIPFEEMLKEKRLQRWHYAHSPIGIWTFDFTKLNRKLTKLPQAVIDNFRDYLSQSPEEAFRLLRSIRTVDFNEAIPPLFGATSSETLMDAIGQSTAIEHIDVFAEMMVAMFNGERIFQRQLIIQTLDNSTKVLMISSPLPTNPEQAARVQISFLDISGQMRAIEEAKKAELSLTQAALGTVDVLAATIEKRDPYAAGHQHQVSELSVEIGRHLGWDKHRLQGLKLGALIHNVGTVYIPAEILNRPGTLEAAEMSIIHSHSEIGAEIVGYADFPWPIQTMILQHHERIDGSGYPSGLKGEAIIDEAKILAVANVYCAMTSHRPSRSALSSEVVLAEIQSSSGVLYDEEIVDALSSVIQSAKN